MLELLVQLISNNSVVAPLIFIILRASAIIFPPIPGFAVDLIGLTYFGWLLGFIYAEIGIMLGAIIAFIIARKFREPIIKKFVSIKKVHEWESKLSRNKKFWTIVAIRLPSNTPFFDYINYALGLTKISFPIFFFSAIISNFPITFSFYYFGGLAFQSGLFYVILFLIAIIIFWILFYKKKISKSHPILQNPKHPNYQY